MLVVDVMVSRVSRRQPHRPFPLRAGRQKVADFLRVYGGELCPTLTGSDRDFAAIDALLRTYGGDRRPGRVA